MQIELSRPLMEAIARFECTVPQDVSEVHIARLFDLALQEREYTDEKYSGVGYYAIINGIYRDHDDKCRRDYENSKQKENVHAT